jgi:hypothetical protein
VEGETLGDVPLPGGRLVVADDSRPVAELFGEPGRDAGVTRDTRSIVLFSVAVPGVPAIHVEEALWTVWDIVAG